MVVRYDEIDSLCVVADKHLAKLLPPKCDIFGFRTLHVDLVVRR